MLAVGWADVPKDIPQRGQMGEDSVGILGDRTYEPFCRLFHMVYPRRLNTSAADELRP